jgi:hypothetical protein
VEGRSDVCGGVYGVVAVHAKGREGVCEGFGWLWWAGVGEVWVGFWLSHVDELSRGLRMR